MSPLQLSAAGNGYPRRRGRKFPGIFRALRVLLSGDWFITGECVAKLTGQASSSLLNRRFSTHCCMHRGEKKSYDFNAYLKRAAI